MSNRERRRFSTAQFTLKRAATAKAAHKRCPAMQCGLWEVLCACTLQHTSWRCWHGTQYPTSVFLPFEIHMRAISLQFLIQTTYKLLQLHTTMADCTARADKFMSMVAWEESRAGMRHPWQSTQREMRLVKVRVAFLS